MRILKHIVLFLFVGLVFDGVAQQMPHFTQYLMNSYVINPAIAGTKPYYEAKLNHREQWVGITDAPRTNVLSVNGPVGDHMGAGGYVFTDINGPTRQYGLALSFAYQIILNENLRLSTSLYGSVMQFGIDASKITTQPIDDPVLTNGLQSSVIPDAGASAYLFSDKYFVGLSLAQLTHTRIRYKQTVTAAEGRLTGHYFLMGGYNYDINENFRLQPSVLIKYVNPVPPQAEVFLNATYKEMLSAALSYRTSDAIGLTLSYTHKNYLTLGYSYDVTTSDLGNYSSGSHEVMLGIRFKKQYK